ncbi:MAG: type II toxin-antitoxin system VapC family toxin [Candidatus Limnocylindria bacterium]
MVVVDSSAWIEFLRGTGSPVHLTLRRMLAENAELATTEVVVMEVLAGARDEAHRSALRERLLAFPVLALRGLADYEAAAELYRSCRSRGATVRRLVDCLIAIPSIRAGASVLHADRDFDQIARCAPLRIEALGST